MTVEQRSEPHPPKRQRTRRVVLVLAACAMAGFVVNQAISIIRPEPVAGHWRNQAGYEAYRAAYDEAMATMPVPTRVHDLRIEFGSVRVYEWAADDSAHDALPVVLVPGIRSGVPMWAGNLRHWIGSRTVYAMDAVGDAGLSTHTVPFESFDHQVDWIEQTLAGLELGRAHLLGHSFGGAIAATHALHYPDRVASLTLLEPVMVLHAMPPSTYLWGSILSLPVPQSWKDRALAEIGGVSVDAVQERTSVSVMIDEGSKHYKTVQLTPRTLTDTEWRSMPMPIRIEIAANKSLAGGQEAAVRARGLGLESVVVRPNTTHSLPMQAATELGSEMREYWTTHDR